MFAWQATVQDERGNAVPSPVVTVYESDGATLASIYSEAGGALPNPFTGTLEGFVQFWVHGGRYKIEGASGADQTEVWPWHAGVAAVPTAWADFGKMLGMPEGSVVPFNGVQFERSMGASVAGLPTGAGWKPFGGYSVAAFGGSVPASLPAGVDNVPVQFGPTLWASDAFPGYRSIYGTNKYRAPLRSRVQAGRLNALGAAASWSEDGSPIDVVAKVSRLSRDADPTAWDQSHYVGLIKDKGNAFGVASTAAVHQLSGGGDLIAAHHRAIGFTPDAEIFGTWSYVATPTVTTDHVVDAIGHEINLNLGFDAVWAMPDGKGATRGLVVNTADGGKTAHTGISVGAHPGTGKWLQGIVIKGVAIKGDVGDTIPTRALTIEGSPSSADRYRGIVFGSGYLRAGIDMSEVPIGGMAGEAAITLPASGRIRWGSIISSRWVGVSASGDTSVNFNNYTISVNGSKVIGPQGAAVPNATDAATAITQLNALLARLRAHGLIAT